MRDITGVLLAAGSGLRFGGHKLLRPLTDGTPLGVVAARNLLAALPHSIAVVRADDAILSAFLSAEGMRVVVCDKADQGMSASLIAGISASLGAQGWVIALADMPFVRPHTVRSIVTLLQQGVPLAAPSYQGERGHPVGFSRRFRDELLKLTGDHGARDLLVRNASQLILHPVNDPGILTDVDTPADISACLS